VERNLIAEMNTKYPALAKRSWNESILNNKKRLSSWAKVVRSANDRSRRTCSLSSFSQPGAQPISKRCGKRPSPSC